MKKQILILLAIISILVSSCNDDELHHIIPYFGFAKAVKTGRNWQPYIYALNDPGDKNYLYISMNIHNKQGFIRETLSFHRVAKREGYNAIKSQEIIVDADNENNIRYYSSYYTSMADGDVICGSYKVADSTDVAGHVIVTKYDEKSGVIEGTFEVTLIKRQSCDPTAPDTIHFTEGVFYTKIQH